MSDVWICLFVAIISPVGSVASFVDGDVSSGLLLMVATGVFGALWWYVRDQRRRAEEFGRWVCENARDIERGRGWRNGVRITSYTEVRQFRFCASFLFLTVRVSCCPKLPHEDVRNLRMIYGLITAVMGWWGFPWGPIHSVSALVDNARGGTRVPLHAVDWR